MEIPLKEVSKFDMDKLEDKLNEEN